MDLKFAAMPTESLAAGANFIQPEEMPKVVHEDDPSRYVMVDFTKIEPIIADQYEHLPDARARMEQTDLHVSLVVDDMKNLVGFLSLDEILSDKPVKFINNVRTVRKDVLVKAVMTPLVHVVAVDFEHMRFAKVGNVISTLNSAQAHYVVVFERSPSNEVKVRGYFNVARISRAMGENVFKKRFVAPTVAELAKTLHT